MLTHNLHDVAVIGGGPAGLSFAASLRETHHRIVLMDKHDELKLSDPRYDGREIALTLESVQTLRALGAWERLAAEAAPPLRGARVFNGECPNALDLGRPGAPWAFRREQLTSAVPCWCAGWSMR